MGMALSSKIQTIDDENTSPTENNSRPTDHPTPSRQPHQHSTPTKSPPHNRHRLHELYEQFPPKANLLHQYNPLTHTTSFIGKTGGQIFHEMMRLHNVKHIFGYPGGTILPILDALYASPHLTFILPKHEQSAGHMAEGYARASTSSYPTPGIVLVTSGPGATNLITPLQNALSDGTPLIAFCGQVATSAIGKDGFQEADVLGMTRFCTKWNVGVKHVRELPQRIEEAFWVALSGRMGPVVVEVPKDVGAGIYS
ncbi:thiamine pyrophosphate enzyme, N-terminal TPP binding domain-domain-containing protein [Aspergillus niger]|nr:thiamine pyrophosphate enzyme, N-terminal TPP binding domain-domain-containing protein [Aspergillus niger]